MDMQSIFQTGVNMNKMSRSMKKENIQHQKSMTFTEEWCMYNKWIYWEPEIKYWKDVLKHIIAILRFLAETSVQYSFAIIWADGE